MFTLTIIDEEHLIYESHMFNTLGQALDYVEREVCEGIDWSVSLNENIQACLLCWPMDNLTLSIFEVVDRV